MSSITELYKITESGSDFFFTSDNKSVLYSGDTYTPVPISRSDIISSQELAKANLEVRISLNQVDAKRWITTVIDSSISVVVFKQEDAVTSQIWEGRLTSIKAGKADVIMTFESSFTSLRNPGMRKRYQRTCPHVLYGDECKAVKASFGTAATATTVRDTDITVSEAALQPDGFYSGGILEDASGASRFIRSHSGSTLTLSRPLFGLANGNSITIFPGCARTTTVCNDRFSNIAHFGGYPFIPLKNVFGGESLV